MKVKELIALLERFDQDSRVLITTYSDTVLEEVGRLRLLPADGSVVIEPKPR
jgi:hypothetical protein